MTIKDIQAYCASIEFYFVSSHFPFEMSSVDCGCRCSREKVRLSTKKCEFHAVRERKNQSMLFRIRMLYAIQLKKLKVKKNMKQLNEFRKMKMKTFKM